MKEQHISFDYSAPYYTLNQLTNETTDVVIACPGYGQLAKYFIKRFDVFNPQTHFVLVLQGLSKFYLPDQKHVGASWMTKEDRTTELDNQRLYFRAVIQKVFDDYPLEKFRLHLLGFSQGVSMISRMAAASALQFNNLVLWAGGFPPELTTKDFEHIDTKSKLKVVLGDHDEYYQLDKNYQKEIDKMEKAIGLKAELITFDGRHEMSREVLVDGLIRG